MPVTKRTRYEVLKRDNHTCRYCGGSAPDVKLTVDHVMPVALGGSDKPDNLVAACVDCNAGKSSSAPGAPLVEDVRALDFKWADAMKRAAAIKANERRRENAYLRAFDDAWGAYGRRPSADPNGVARLYLAGLPKKDMLWAAELASTNRGVYDRFSYFMGLSWKRLTDLQDTAKQLLAAEEGE